MTLSEGGKFSGEPNPESKEGLSRLSVRGSYINRGPSGWGPEGVSLGFTGDITVDDLSGRLLGRVNDEFGPAAVIGEKYPDILCFNKLYLNRSVNPYPIVYEFRKSPTDEWIGSYSYQIINAGGLEEISRAATMEELPPPDREVTTRGNFQMLYDATIEDLARIREEIDQAIGRSPRNPLSDDLPY